MKVVAISDTHGRHKQIDVPEGDVLIFAGDMCTHGDHDTEVEGFQEWWSEHPHDHKIVVAGNHDWPLYRADDPGEFFPDSVYLEDESVEIDGVKFYGSPWQPEFCDWAFNLPRGEALAQHWEMIDDDTDVLITHGPPHDVFDQVSVFYGPRRGETKLIGCRELRKRVAEVQPTLHLFGHNHEQFGHTQKDPSLLVDEDITGPTINFANINQRNPNSVPFVMHMPPEEEEIDSCTS